MPSCRRTRGVEWLVPKQPQNREKSPRDAARLSGACAAHGAAPGEEKLRWR
jgi:hypothetical protein